MIDDRVAPERRDRLTATAGWRILRGCLHAQLPIVLRLANSVPNCANASRDGAIASSRGHLE
jgi:hypothetical protein